MNKLEVGDLIYIKELKDIFIYLENNASNVYTSICLQELQAINKQIEELGWSNE